MMSGLRLISLLLLLSSSSMSAVPPQCRRPDPNDAGLRQLCRALLTLRHVSNAVEAYLDQQNNGEPLLELVPVAHLQGPPAEGASALPNSGVKRQMEDPDHVFLRFGRSNRNY